jgi:hypothetical protein
MRDLSSPGGGRAAGPPDETGRRQKGRNTPSVSYRTPPAGQARSWARRVLALALAGLLLAGCGGRAKRVKHYLPTQETAEQFGDGQFEVTATSAGPVVRDNKSSRVLLRDVAGWYEDGDRVFAVNKKGEYLVLNTEDGTAQFYGSLDEVPEDLREAAARTPRRAVPPPPAGS